MKNIKSKSPSKAQKIPFIYRSFFYFWLAVVLPACTLALIITKLYYNNTLNWEPLKNPNTWFYFILIQVFAGFFTYLWVYRVKAKSYKN